jgi:hypothetical protein
VKITLNGEPFELDRPLTVTELLSGSTSTPDGCCRTQLRRAQTGGVRPAVINAGIKSKSSLRGRWNHETDTLTIADRTLRRACSSARSYASPGCDGYARGVWRGDDYRRRRRVNISDRSESPDYIDSSKYFRCRTPPAVTAPTKRSARRGSAVAGFPTG